MSPEEDLVSETAKPFSLTERIGQFMKGALKGATTDLVGAPVDIMNEIVGAVSLGKLKSRDPIGGSKHLRRVLAGAGEVEDSSIAETIGTMVNPENAAKAMIIGAARIPSRYKNYVQELGKVKTEGLTPDKAALFDKTGVYFDKDKKHKTIVSDKDASLNMKGFPGYKLGMNHLEPRPNQVLSDVLVHDELYKLYPELKTIPVQAGGAAQSGSMMPDNSLMTIGGNDPNGLLTVILHEAQHGVQHIEGFAKGGNIRQFTDFDPTSVQIKLNRARQSGDVSQKDAADRFAKKANDALAEARNRYLNLPGEQEARYTQKTAFMSADALGADVRELLRRGDTPQTYNTRPIRPIPGK